MAHVNQALQFNIHALSMWFSNYSNPEPYSLSQNPYLSADALNPYRPKSMIPAPGFQGLRSRV